MIYDLIVDYQYVINNISQLACVQNVKSFVRFVQNRAYIFQATPKLVFQPAINQPDESPVHQEAQLLLKLGKIKHPRIKWINKPQSNDEQVITLSGHTAAIMPCAWSDGQRILSTSLKGQLLVWHADTGKKLKTLTVYTRSRSYAWSLDGSKIFFTLGTKLEARDIQTISESATFVHPSVNVISILATVDGG